MVRRRTLLRPCVVEKEHTEMFSVVNFVLSKKKCVVIKQFFLKIKKHSSSYQENAMKSTTK